MRSKKIIEIALIFKSDSSLPSFNSGGIFRTKIGFRNCFGIIKFHY